MGRSSRRNGGPIDADDEDSQQKDDLSKLLRDGRRQRKGTDDDDHDDAPRTADEDPSHRKDDDDDDDNDEYEQDHTSDEGYDESIDEDKDDEGDGRQGGDDDEEEVTEESETEPTDHDDTESRAQSKDSSNKDEKKPAKKVHKLSLAQTEDFNEKLRKRGVVYVARIPPRMTPTKIKALLGEHGEVTRVYLVEEDAAVRRKRRKLHGGNGSKRYTEGWVEFASKQVAKHVAASLNASAITHYKRSPHYGDLWSLKYLRGFKWSHLTEKVAYERRVREQRLRLETMQARRDTVAYKQLVETGKKLDKIEGRKRRREERQGGTSGGIGGRNHHDDDNNKKAKYQPKQVPQIDADSSQRGASKKPLLGSLL
jgi:ESF2/ABP1 family protein